jgi:hypothetical protein
VVSFRQGLHLHHHQATKLSGCRPHHLPPNPSLLGSLELGKRVARATRTIAAMPERGNKTAGAGPGESDSWGEQQRESMAPTDVRAER